MDKANYKHNMKQNMINKTCSSYFKLNNNRL